VSVSSAELANSFFEFGLSFSLLGASEADALGSALSSFATVSEKLAMFTNTLVRAMCHGAPSLCTMS
jgi:hypothetical protein